MADIAAIMWRSKFVILLSAFVAALFSIHYSLNVAEPLYSAQARLVIDVEEENIVDVQSVISGVSTDEAAINTEMQIILSRSMIEELVNELDLLDDPEFNAALRETSMYSISGLIGVLRELVSGPVPPMAQQTQFNNTVDEVTRALRVSPVRNTYVFDIGISSSSAEKSKRIVNTLANLYMQRQIDEKNEVTENAIVWLSERVSELEMTLSEQTDQVEELRQNTTLVSSEALDGQIVQAIDLRRRISQAQAAVGVEEARYQDLVSAMEAGNREAIATMLDSAELDRLLSAIDAGEADAREAFDARVASLARNLRQDVARQQSQITALQASLDDLSAQIDEQTEDRNRLNQMTREAEATRVLYETFLTRLRETSVQVGLQQADSKVLSKAIPGRQVSPRPVSALAIATVLGALLGTVIVLVRQLTYSGVRNATELERVTGYRVLGSIPLIPIRQRRKLLTYIESNPTSIYAEAVRNLRTSILMHNLDRPPQVITMTSSLPGEGKTVSSISLAMSLASMENRRVLLIDADTRRATLRHYIAEKPKASLATLLSGETTLDDTVLKAGLPNVDVITAGNFSVKNVNIFDTVAFDTMLRTARDRYDHIVIDTPPVLILPDARSIGARSDAVVYTVLWNQTTKSQMTDGLELLKRTHAPIIGTILSRVNFRKMKSYGYTSGYYGGYGAYGYTGKGYFNVS